MSGGYSWPLPLILVAKNGTSYQQLALSPPRLEQPQISRPGFAGATIRDNVKPDPRAHGDRHGGRQRSPRGGQLGWQAGPPPRWLGPFLW